MLTIGKRNILTYLDSCDFFSGNPLMLTFSIINKICTYNKDQNYIIGPARNVKCRVIEFPVE